MKLHTDPKLFQQAVRATAQFKGIQEIYIEKDYWVTFALHTIFHERIGKETVFKGGTALSKCYGFIERFSEDIDLVVLRSENESNNQLTKKIKRISAVMEKAMPEVQVDNITRKMGMNRKTAHEYNKAFKGDYGQIRDVVIVEATWLGYFEPYSTKQVASYIYDMMKAQGQEEIIIKYNLAPFELNVLSPKRTLCEKIMSLVRFSYGDNPEDDLKKKIRHTYDLHQLLAERDISYFFQSSEFVEMILKVAQDDVDSYKSNNAWLANHPNEAQIFKNLDKTWEKLSSTYNTTFKNLVFGKLPDESEIVKTLHAIRTRLASIEWKIHL